MLFVFIVKVLELLTVKSLSSVPKVQVLLPLIVSNPGPRIWFCITKSLLMVRFPTPVITVVLVTFIVDGNTALMLSMSVPLLLKVPVPLTVVPVL